MRPLSALVLLLTSAHLNAQTAGDIQLRIDPPGDMHYAAFVDGAVTDNGEIYFLGGYQNVAESAFTLAKFTATGAPIWGRKVETTAPDLHLGAKKVLVDDNGNITVFGTLGSGLGPGYFLMRLTPDGVMVWERFYLSDELMDEYGSSSALSLDDGGVMMSLGVLDKAVMVRVDAVGDVVWSQGYITSDFPTGKNPGFEPAFTPDGGALITAKAENDMYLVRIDANGLVQWSNRYSTGTYTHTRTAVSLADGGYLVVGSSDLLPFAARLDGTGGLIWNRTYALDEGWIDGFSNIQPLPDGGFLLSPSMSSMGVMGVRITASGEPVEVALVEGNGSASVIGTQGDQVLMMGRTTVEQNGGFEDLFMLLKLNPDLGMGCLRATSGASSAIQTLTGAPVPGCITFPEPLIVADLYTVISDILFTTRDLCASVTAVPEQPIAAPIAVFPSPAPSGTSLTVDLRNAKDVTRVDLLASDGRTVRSVRVASRAERVAFDTDGIGPGLYLLRTMDVHGTPGYSSRIVIE